MNRASGAIVFGGGGFYFEFLPFDNDDHYRRTNVFQRRERDRLIFDRSSRARARCDFFAQGRLISMNNSLKSRIVDDDILQRVPFI